MSSAVEDADVPVEDEAEKEQAEHSRFSITSYGADYPVELLAARVKRGDFYTPPFQRDYVWTLPEASRFIESLLLGLPVPSVFLFREPDSGRHLIIDGQQRLKTLQFFLSGQFRDKAFRLQDVSAPWNGKTYDELPDDDRRRLNDSLVHAIIFRQDTPEEGNQSIYEIFERLNSGGTKLSPQEIRTCVSHGPFVQLLEKLNEGKEWREIYGPVSSRGKDRELILRFLALLSASDQYRKPMKTFLDSFLEKNRGLAKAQEDSFSKEFQTTIRHVYSAIGPKAFRPERNLNASVFDGVSVGLARALAATKLTAAQTKSRYDKILANKEFQAAWSVATSDEENVKTRVRLAEQIFRDG